MSLQEMWVSGDDPLWFFLGGLYMTLIPDLLPQDQIHMDQLSWLLASYMTILSHIPKLIMKSLYLSTQYWFTLKVQRTQLI